MAGVNRKTDFWKQRGAAERIAAKEFSYPTGMVWCPMKMSGMALMRCAELQKEFGCGSLRQFRIVTSARPENAPFHWPWLRRGRECPERADEKEVRELRLVLSPLKLVDKSRKNPRAYHCPACGCHLLAERRQCHGCWRLSASR